MSTSPSKAAAKWLLLASLSACAGVSTGLYGASSANVPYLTAVGPLQTTGKYLLQDVAASSRPASTRIELRLNAPVSYQHKESSDARHIYLDMQDTRFSLSLIRKAYSLQAGPVEHVLLSHNASPATRLVLDLSKPSTYSVRMLENPTRLVIDLQTSKSLPKPRWRMLGLDEEKQVPELLPEGRRVLLASTSASPAAVIPSSAALTETARQAFSDSSFAPALPLESFPIVGGDERQGVAYQTSAEFELRPQMPRASLHLRHPTMQSLYEGLSAAFGLKLIFDPDLGNLQKPIVGNFELENATLKEALASAGEVTRAFVSPIDQHTGVVAADTAAKRGEHERQVLASFHLDDSITQQDITEITTVLQAITDLRRIVRDTATNTLSVIGRAHQVDVASELLRSLEKERGEVVVDIDILEVDSQVARSLGIIPPQTFELIGLGVGGVPAASLQALKAIQTLLGVQLPGASATLTYSSSELRSKQTVHLRALSGQQATLTVGDRVPVLNGYVTSSVTTSTNGQTSNYGSYPSIQYQDVGVILKATPYMHAGRELTLKFDLSLRGVTSQSVNGTPIISQRQVTEQVRLKDGETYLMGGILIHSQDSSINGYPGLSHVPLLRYLFSSRDKQRSDSELLVLIRPHVIRRAAAEEYASNTIYFGRELQGIPQAPAAPPPTPVTAGPEGFYQPGAPNQRQLQQPRIQQQGGVPVYPGQQPGSQQQTTPGGIVPFVPGLPSQNIPPQMQQQHE